MSDKTNPFNDNCARSLQEFAQIEINEKLRAELGALKAKTSSMMGVGNGSGNLFVYGDADSIKAVQAIVLERDALKAELEAALKQEPVGYFYLLDFSDTTIYKDKEGDENYAPLYASPVPAQKGTPAYSCVYCGCLELEKVTACHCLPQGAEQKWNEHMVFPALD